MIYIIIPAYNEENNIKQLLLDINKHLDKLDYTILVINDGSIDKTPDIARSLAGQIPIRVIDHDVNKGVGEVFHTGLNVAARELKDNDVVVTIEADATNDPFLIKQMITKLNQGYDVVCASRYENGGGYYNFPFYRLILSYGVNMLFKTLFPITGIKDYSIFYRAYKIEIIKKALNFYGDSFITSKNFASNAEILLKLRRFKVRGAEVPLKYRYDLKKGKSGIKIFRTILEYFKLCWEKTKK